jgi:hypothetical protein
MVRKIPDVSLVLGEEGGGEEEEQNDLEIGGFEDWTIGRFGDVRRDIRLSIFDGRWSIYLEFHGIDHIEMMDIKVGFIVGKCKEIQLDSWTVDSLF